jgi:hypothetical protein
MISSVGGALTFGDLEDRRRNLDQRDLGAALKSSVGGSAVTIGDLEDRRGKMDQRDLGVASFAVFFLTLELGGTSDSLEGLVALTELVAFTEGGPRSDGEAYNWKGEANSGTGWRPGTLLDLYLRLLGGCERNPDAQ